MKLFIDDCFHAAAIHKSLISSMHGDEDVILPSEVKVKDVKVIPQSGAEEVESDGVDNSQQEKQSLISLDCDEGIPPSDTKVIPSSDVEVIPSSDVKVKAWSPQLDIPKNLRWPVLSSDAQHYTFSKNLLKIKGAKHRT